MDKARTGCSSSSMTLEAQPWFLRSDTTFPIARRIRNGRETLEAYSWFFWSDTTFPLPRRKTLE